MLAAHRFCLTGSLLALCVISCDRRDPLAPEMRAASAAGAGPAVNAPSGTNAVAASSSQIDVSWRDNSSNESGFEVHRSTTGAGGPFTLLSVTGIGVTGYSDGGLSPSKTYCYDVRAFRAFGNKKTYSAFSSVACATTPAPPPVPLPPSAPSGMATRPVNSGMVVATWVDNSGNEQGFRGERSSDGGATWVLVALVDSNVMSFNDWTLPSERQVCHRVFAYNDYGTSAASNIACTAPPAPPSALTATGVDASAIDLTWTDNSAVEDGYEVQRTPGDEPWVSVADLPANSTTYRDAGVTSDKTHYYLVRAKRDGGYSDLSNFASAAAASAPPTAPSGTSVSPRSSNAVALTWVDNSSNEDGFRIERSADGGLSWIVVATTIPSPEPFTDTGLISEQLVCYRVFAFNSLGDSPASPIVCTTPPAGPTDLIATAVDAETGDLTWTDNSAVEDGYEVWTCPWLYCSCPYEEGCTLLVSLPANATSFRATLGSFYHLVAKKDGGYSDPAFVDARLP